MSTFGALILSVLVTVILLGGPYTLYALIKVLNAVWGGMKVQFVRLAVKDGSPALGLMVGWDEDSYENEILRVKVDYFELVRGGRSATFSYTFEGKAAKKRSFLLPLLLKADDMEMLTDQGTPGSVKRSFVHVEVETPAGETTRHKINKQKILDVMAGAPYVAPAELEVMPPKAPDDWALLTRIFPWKTAVAVAPGEAKAAAPKAPKAPGAPTLVDFIVTKVWIEPGCIVCDACENEAPQVFKVLADTCIVVENAPLDDGGSIQAAAEGCPVNVIKYDTKPKSA